MPPARPKMRFKLSGAKTAGPRQRRHLLLAAGAFYSISAVVYLASFAILPGIDVQYFVSQIVSVLFLVPLIFWYKSKPAELSNAETSRRLATVSPVIGALYLLAMSVRIPAVAFLKFPLEKTPLIYLVVLTLLLVERKPLASHGFSRAQLKNQLGLGLFLLLGTLLLPVLIIVPIVSALYRVNLLEGYSFLPVVLASPFQVFAVGISEEGFFRGYMQTRLSQVTGTRRAILFQAALFGIWHFVWHINPFDLTGMVFHVASTFVFGILTGVYFRYARSIAGLALFHGLSNSLGEGLNPNVSSLPFSQSTLLAIVGLIELVASALLVILARRICRAFRIRTQETVETDMHLKHVSPA